MSLAVADLLGVKLSLGVGEDAGAHNLFYHRVEDWKEDVYRTIEDWKEKMYL